MNSNTFNQMRLICARIYVCPFQLLLSETNKMNIISFECHFIFTSRRVKSHTFVYMTMNRYLQWRFFLLNHICSYNCNKRLALNALTYLLMHLCKCTSKLMAKRRQRREFLSHFNSIISYIVCKDLHFSSAKDNSVF